MYIVAQAAHCSQEHDVANYVEPAFTAHEAVLRAASRRGEREERAARGSLSETGILGSTVRPGLAMRGKEQ